MPKFSYKSKKINFLKRKSRLAKKIVDYLNNIIGEDFPHFGAILDRQPK